MSLRDFFDGQKKYFEKGAKFEKLEPIFEMIYTFLFPFHGNTSGMTHVRDPLELKRIMMTVMFALTPVAIMALFNTGYQANKSIAALVDAGAAINYTWHQSIMMFLGIQFDPSSIISNFVHGLTYFLPIYITVLIAGGTIEVVFAVIRGHNINESFLVTSLLFPLVLPATVPLWQAALAIAFGIIFGKELFGGTGRNIVNPALFSRAFLFFAYPGSATGASVWYPIDAGSGPTPLAVLKAGGEISDLSWLQAFIGIMPGSMGETSAIACLIGAFILVTTGIGSLRIILSVVVGLAAVVFTANIFGSETNTYMQLGLHWHMVLGGFAFGAVFMATDPVSASFTPQGKIIYGFMIGALTGIVRLVNPAYPEGMMLAILFCNVINPSIDYFIVKRNIKKREVRCAN